MSFSMWLLFAFPLALIIGAVTWVYLYSRFKPGKGQWKEIDRNIFHIELKNMGVTSFEEKAVLTVFVILAILWLFRVDLNFGLIRIPGWASLFPESKLINDGTVAIFMAILLFLLPSRKEKGKKILDWATASKLPWNILLLFGGGFSLATGFKVSGLSQWFGEQLAGVASFHPIVIILVICLVITFLTELTSNTATTEMVLPILVGMAITTGINPLLLMIPATLSASMAFMLPVATPPNAIVFGSNRITVRQMAITGLVLNLVCAVIITLMMYFWGDVIFDATSVAAWSSVK
jgi:sodium-dependent dicarboxylate transporter 2/3/5